MTARTALAASSAAVAVVAVVKPVVALLVTTDTTVTRTSSTRELDGCWISRLFQVAHVLIFSLLSFRLSATLTKRKSPARALGVLLVPKSPTLSTGNYFSAQEIWCWDAKLMIDVPPYWENSAAAEGEAKEPAEPTEEDLARKAAEEERRRQDEEDAKLMTLEQYQAAQAAKRAETAAAPARKANEGVDESQWKTKKFERNEQEEVYFAGKVGRKKSRETRSIDAYCPSSSGNHQDRQGKAQEGQGNRRTGLQVLGRIVGPRSRSRRRIQGRTRWPWRTRWSRRSWRRQRRS